MKREVRIRVFGTSPLLMHNPASMGGREAKRINQIPSPEEEAEAGAYRLADGTLAMPGIAFRNALLKAAGGLKVGRKSLRSILGHLQTSEEWIRLKDPDSSDPIKVYEIDMRRCVVQRQGIIRARPRIERWAAEIGFVYEEDIVPANIEEILRSVMNEAGQTVGVGDYRVEKGGWFGTFEVV